MSCAGMVGSYLRMKTLRGKTMNKLGNSIIAKLTCEKLALEALSSSIIRASKIRYDFVTQKNLELREQVAELNYKLKAYAEF